MNKERRNKLAKLQKDLTLISANFNKDKIIKMLGLNPKKIGKYFTKDED